MWLILATVPVSLFVIMMLGIRVEHLLGLAVLILISSDAWAFQGTAVSALGRALAAAICVLIVGREYSRRSRGLTGSIRGLAVFAGVIWLMLTFIGLEHGELRTTAQAALGMVTILMILPAAGIAGPKAMQSMVLQKVFGLFFVGSLALGVLVPDMAFRGSRLVGLTSNANLLGFYCFLALALAMIATRRAWWEAITLPAAVACLVWSGSRGGALAFLVVVVGCAALGIGHVRRWMVPVGVVALIGVPLWPGLLGGSTGLLRSSNTRSMTWRAMQDALASNPVAGVGLQPLNLNVLASSPMRALAAGGFVGGGLLLAAMVCLMIWSWRSPGRRNPVLVAALLIHSLLEGWLVSLTGAMFMTVLVTLVIVRELDVALSADPQPGSAQITHA